VVCLGVVRGNAARALFHAGPKNRTKKGNIYRSDYLLCVRRMGKKKVKLVLDTNRPYRYLRLNLEQVRKLHRAIVTAYGEVKTM